MKLCSFNLENFYLNFDKCNSVIDVTSLTDIEFQSMAIPLENTQRDTYKNKSLYKTLLLKDFIEESDADIYCFQEIIKKKSLYNLNHHFLNDKYNLCLHEKNSERDIYVGFLLSKKLEYVSEDFSDLKLKNGQRCSRNITCIHIKKDDKIIISIIGIHLKSKRNDVAKSQALSFDIREQEVSLILNICEEIKNKHNSKIILMGDFNAQINEDELFKLNHDFVNFNDLNKSYIGTFGTPYLEQKIQQIDYILIEKKHESMIDLANSYIYRFKNEYGDSISLPFNNIEKTWLPSDHLPIILTLKREFYETKF